MGKRAEEAAGEILVVFISRWVVAEQEKLVSVSMTLKSSIVNILIRGPVW